MITALEVRALAKLVDELDYYQLLELDRSAPASAIKQAYYAVSRKLHPDANRQLVGAERDALARIAKRISEAYQVLRDQRRRQAYDAQLAGGQRRIALAEADLDKGDLQSAARNMKMALTFEPANDGFKKVAEQIRVALRNAPPGAVGPPPIGR